MVMAQAMQAQVRSQELSRRWAGHQGPGSSHPPGLSAPASPLPSRTPATPAPRIPCAPTCGYSLGAEWSSVYFPSQRPGLPQEQASGQETAPSASVQQGWVTFGGGRQGKEAGRPLVRTDKEIRCPLPTKPPLVLWSLSSHSFCLLYLSSVPHVTVYDTGSSPTKLPEDSFASSSF